MFPADFTSHPSIQSCGLGPPPAGAWPTTGLAYLKRSTSCHLKSVDLAIEAAASGFFAWENDGLIPHPVGFTEPC